MTDEIRDVAPASRLPQAIRSLASGAALVLLIAAVLWARGSPTFVAWQLAYDHERCLGRTRLRPRLWTNLPEEAREWLESRGTPVQPLPARAGDVELIGVRYCPLYDRVAAHLYYAGGASRVSVFILSGPVRIRDGWQGETGALKVRLMRSAGRTLAIVGSVDADVEAMTQAFRSSVA